MQRLNMALQELKAGRSTTDVAFDSGYESLSGFGYTCKKLTGFAPSAQRQVVLIHRFTTPLAVSYTHLDVYKRQVRLFELIHPGYPPIPQAIWHDWRKDYDIAPVSYTHLSLKFLNSL